VVEQWSNNGRTVQVVATVEQVVATNVAFFAFSRFNDRHTKFLFPKWVFGVLVTGSFGLYKNAKTEKNENILSRYIF
jgi:hypothetical protein